MSARHDYAALGFKCGIEIHQQLDTGKLFCRCKSGVIDVDDVPNETVFTLRRRLRPTASELGEMDTAAAAEARRGLTFVYQGIRGHSCLVEADEEPPHDPDANAMDIALTFAGLVGSRPVDEVEFMRKLVIDGSNTSGFQRTGLVATGGAIDDVGVWIIALEEDSCRKLDKDEEGLVHYTLDRLGVPLIEIATAPDIRDPEHAKATAARIGALLRATGRVRRGLGTIRQDLNVSIAEGDRVEIKGVQDLRAVVRVIDAEIDRQKHLVKVRDELKSRGVSDDIVMAQEVIDVTELFDKSDSKVIKGALKNKGKVLALKLPHFAGLIKGETKDGPRLGREFAAYAKKDAGVRGVFHSDEMPAYGITQDEADAVAARLGLGGDDGYVLAAERKNIATKALLAVRERARLALVGVPREVRAAQVDDSTTYMRPLPGAARMYPETDVRPVPVGPSKWAEVLATLPEKPEESVARLRETHGLSGEIALQLVAEGHLHTFDEVTAIVARPNELSRLLLQTLPELAGDGVDVSGIGRAELVSLMRALDSGAFAKEAVTDVAKALAEAPDAGIDAAIESAGAGAIDSAEVETIIARIVSDQADFVKERGPAAMGPLMGIVMKELRGKADGQLVSKVLQAEIKKHA